MSGTLGGLPEYRASVTQERAPVNRPVQIEGGGGMAALSQALAGAANIFAREAGDRAATQGREEGRNVTVERDPEGRPIAPEMRGGMLPGDRAYDAAARVAFMDTAKQDFQTQFTRLATETVNTPEAFLPQARAAIEGAASAWPEWARGELSRELDGQAQGIARGQVAQWAGVQRRQMADAWQRQLSTYGDELRGLAFNGQEGTPDFQAAATRMRAQLDRGVLAGHISPEQRGLLEAETLTNAAAFTVAGEAGRIAAQQGPEQATAWLNRTLSEPRFAEAGNAAVSAAREEGRRAIQEFRLDRGIAREEARAQLQALDRSMAAGVEIPATAWEAAAVAADKAGMGREAAEARGMIALGGELRGLAGQPLPLLTQALGDARQADPSDPLAGLRARQIGQMVQARVRALSDDPVSWARTQPAVQQAVRAGGDRGAVVRVQDAVLSAQGIPLGAAPVLPDAEVSTLKAQLAAAPPTQQAAMLTEVFDAHGPDMRWRVMRDLERAGLPNGMGSALLLMTSPQGRSALPAFLEAVQARPEALTAIAGGEDRAKQVREAVASALEPLRETLPSGGYDRDFFDNALRATTTLALSFATGNVTPAEAARRAHDLTVAPNAEVVTEGNAAFRVPRGVDFNRPEFLGTLRQLSGPMLNAASLRVPAGAVPERPGMTEAQRQEAYRSSLAAYGRWEQAPGSVGAWLHDNEGRGVLRADGTPFVLTWQDARRPIAEQPLLSGGFVPLARTAAQAANLPDPDHFLRMVGVESSWRLGARSPAGALGLAQIMPATAREVAAEQGVSFDEARLTTDAGYNLSLGAAYYGEMRGRYGGNDVLATAAYNMGPGALDGFLAGKQGVPNETRAYVGKLFGVQPAQVPTLLRDAAAGRPRS